MLIFCDHVSGFFFVFIMFTHYNAIMLPSRSFEFLFVPHVIIELLGIVLFVHPLTCHAIALLQGLRFKLYLFHFLYFFFFFVMTCSAMTFNVVRV